MIAGYEQKNRKNILKGLKNNFTYYYLPMSDKKKIYTLRINCSWYKDYHVRAKSKKEALEMAIADFQCDCCCWELCEFDEWIRDDWIVNEMNRKWKDIHSY